MNILITGATSGIGHELARELARRGHTIYACCHAKEELEQLIKRRQSNIHYLKLDITRQADYQVLANLPIDVLVNQAGIGIGGSLLDLEIDEVRRNFEVNVFSTLCLTKFYIETCKKTQRKGKVLITSSLAGYLPIPYLGSYAATKASLIILTKVLREELRLAGLPIQVKLILPGAYYTGFNQSMLSHISPASSKTYLKMNQLFQLIEKKKLDSIVSQMARAVTSNTSKLIYSAPIFQRMMTRIYRIFSK